MVLKQYNVIVDSKHKSVSYLYASKGTTITYYDGENLSGAHGTFYPGGSPIVHHKLNGKPANDVINSLFVQGTEYDGTASCSDEDVANEPAADSGAVGEAVADNAAPAEDVDEGDNVEDVALFPGAASGGLDNKVAKCESEGGRVASMDEAIAACGCDVGAEYNDMTGVKDYANTQKSKAYCQCSHSDIVNVHPWGLSVGKDFVISGTGYGGYLFYLSSPIYENYGDGVCAK